MISVAAMMVESIWVEILTFREEVSSERESVLILMETACSLLRVTVL
jgi:hypothetical protein